MTDKYREHDLGTVGGQNGRLFALPPMPVTRWDARAMSAIELTSLQDVSPASALRQRGLPLRGHRVLLVEDNPLNQLVAQAFLQQTGLEVETLNDGDEAVRLIAHTEPGRFAVILMDLHMPVLDGLEASRRIRQMPQASQLPIIAMTASAMPSDRTLCQEAGMVDVVTKPIMPVEFIDTLLKWVAH